MSSPVPLQTYFEGQTWRARSEGREEKTGPERRREGATRVVRSALSSCLIVVVVVLSSRLEMNIDMQAEKPCFSTDLTPKRLQLLAILQPLHFLLLTRLGRPLSDLSRSSPRPSPGQSLFLHLNSSSSRISSHLSRRRPLSTDPACTSTSSLLPNQSPPWTLQQTQRRRPASRTRSSRLRASIRSRPPTSFRRTSPSRSHRGRFPCCLSG